MYPHITATVPPLHHRHCVTFTPPSVLHPLTIVNASPPPALPTSHCRDPTVAQRCPTDQTLGSAHHFRLPNPYLSLYSSINIDSAHLRRHSLHNEIRLPAKKMEKKRTAWIGGESGIGWWRR
ncbi:unnamed protein product [Cuscuta europaea]|uniref:Uncharacterized protein n=1 Tax=Cuscuta europaea TaxID=41803 RepID=A0A9P0ZEN3_CUSEU|nr:unnamed protein product [Cuscuta europaea]